MICPLYQYCSIPRIINPSSVPQVSRLVILHEEAEDGNAMPELARPVQAVALAVNNLVKVTCTLRPLTHGLQSSGGNPIKATAAFFIKLYLKG